MKIFLSIILFILCFSLSAIDLKSKVSAVTVFLNQAEVVRTAKAKVNGDTKELIFTGLSNQLDQNSIQVKGTGDFIILGTSYRYNYLTEEDATGKVKDLQDKVSAQKRTLSEYTSRLVVLDAEEDLLKSNKVIGGGDAKVTAAELKAMADYYRARLLAISTDRYDVKIQQEAAQKELQKLQNQLNQENNKVKQVAGEVVVEISNTKPQDIELTLTYMVRGASWKPSYDLRADASLGDLQLVYKAAIQQSTGENWDNVRLSLSTSNPSSGTSLPVLSPWYMDFVQAIQYRSKQSGGMRSEALMSSQPMMEMAVADEAYDVTDISQSLLSINYVIQFPTSIPSNGKSTTVSVRKEKLSAEFLYQSVPRISEKVYLVAKTQDWMKLDLLAGYMNVFYDGGFINETYINPSQNPDELSISFGVDEALTIKHKAVKNYTDDQNIGSKRRVDFEYEIQVRNNKSNTIPIEVFDQLPVSKNDDIEINEVVLNGGTLTKSTGEIKWAFDLSQSASKNWKFGYQVKYPRDKKVNGL